ncbi:acetokinase [Helicobacter pylori]|uniref:acetokinase n=1 Tax=Helicobacter pylori TaxID=210 RepID=UPI000EAD81B3|nr:acetokinase [Helicobacter pylori]
MEILVLNLGSSSIKFKLFDMKENKPLASGLAEKIGEEIGQLKIKSHLHHNDQELSANKSLEEVMKILNHESGLKGICGDNDARNIEARKENGDKQAKLAFEMCAYRVKKHVGAYMVALGRVDAIIFTGGLGENYSALRESVCEGLENLGIALHKPTNDNPGNGLVDLSQPDAKVKVLLIPTDEELEIALQTKKVLETIESKIV